MQILVTGVQHAIQTFRKYSNVEDKLEEVARRLCTEVGEPIIRSVHGRHATRIKTEKTDKGYRIIAEGTDVLFIEFGTGDMAGQIDVLYDKVSSKVRPGSWSEKHAQMYSRFGFWVFGGVKYEYTEPHPAFYYAYQDMVQALPRIATEVFLRR